MAWNALVNPLTNQFYPDLIPGGGGGGQVNSITGGAVHKQEAITWGFGIIL